MTLSLDDAKQRLADGDAAGARSAAREILNVTPDNATAWAVLAQAFMIERDWEAAETAAKKSLSLSPDDLENVILLGRIKNNRRELAQAEALFERAAVPGSILSSTLYTR